MRWLHDRSIGQKFFISFGVILTLLALSLTALIFYLSRINSYVDRHKRITVPAIVTAATMQRAVYELDMTFLSLEQLGKEADVAQAVSRLTVQDERLRRLLELYRSTHAARTHPILFGMLTEHHRVDLADQEDRAIAGIEQALHELNVLWKPDASLSQALAAGDRLPFVNADRLLTQLMEDLDRLVQAHTDIDAEMKVEGDLLLHQARLIALGLVAILGLVITVIYLSVNRQIARPLQRLAVTADRVAHHDLTAHFESWANRDEVGTLAASLSSMVISLREQTAATARKTKELEAFTYSVAHDLKGPLREIEGFSSLLEKQFSDSGEPQTRHHIEVIRRSALRLTHMIDALLKYSRLEQQDLPRQRFNVLEMITGLITDRFSGLQGPKHKVQVALPFADLYGEPVSIRQALVNLLDNAGKFSRLAAPPTITIGGTQTATERILWIQDNGIGFDQTQHDKIFGLFERLHGPQDYEGTGVGLAIVKLVMDKHNGRAWAESTPGTGSRFYLAFPTL
ncbi:MAG: PAS/PAC sensor signal transduction histidine kinase [Nitrospira sp.]|jgi:signal transduction histidine kinase|nr:MAG: PAS/PAC sensor signal transduction histidine kinase [Nitrospira sp.]